MNRLIKRIFSIFLVLLISLAFYVPVRADDEDEGDDETINIIDNFYVPTTRINQSFIIPFNRSWFKGDARIYYHNLAKASIGLATAAFRPKGIPEDEGRKTDYNLTYFLSQAGFKDFRSDDYDKDPNRYTVSTVISHQHIGNGDDAFELISVGICGQGYLDEWESNFSIGTGDNPDGFVRSAQLVYDRIFGYIAANHIKGKIKIWITGFSRAAAIANITAAWLSDEDIFTQENVFAYTFATPMTTREEEPERYDNIFNIVGKTDPVPCIPFADWGYSRYGETFYTPTLETDSDFNIKREKADVIYKEITGISYWYNPDINLQIRIIMDSLLKLCPDVETYVASLQDNIIYLWEKHDPVSVFSRVLEMAEDPILINENNREDASMFLNQITGMIMDYVASENSFRRFNEEASMASNVMQTHTPEQYVSWIFSSDSPVDLYSPSSVFTQVYIDGDVTVSLLRNDALLETLKTGDPDYSSLQYLSICDGKIAVLIPRDEQYRVLISSDKDQTISVLEANFEIGYQAPVETDTAYYDLKAGDTMNVEYLSDYAGSYSKDSSYTETGKFGEGYYYDSSGLVNFAFFNSNDITWRDMVLGVIIVCLLTISLVLFVCAVLVIYLRFRNRRKKGFIPRNVHFRPLPILCFFLIQQLFLIKEFQTALYDASVSRINFFKIVIGLLILVIAFYGWRRHKDRYHAYIIYAVLILDLADVFMTSSLTIGALLHIAAYMLLCYNYTIADEMEKAEIIAWVILSLIELFVIVRIPGEFGLLRFLAALYLLSATGMTVTSFVMPRRTFRGSALLFLSGILLIYNTVNGTTFLSHIAASGLYYIAVITLASTGNAFKRPKMVPESAIDWQTDNEIY